MSLCEYCQIGSYTEHCICQRANDICPLVRRCDVKQIWLPLDSMESCTRRLNARKEDIVLGANEYKVVLVKGSQLWVDYKDNIVTFFNPFDSAPDKVEIVTVQGKPYIKGTEPKQEKVEHKKSKKGE